MISTPSLEIINKIIGMYRYIYRVFITYICIVSEAVEYFDSKQDPVKFYFVDKIQYALAETKNFNIVRQSFTPESSSASKT
jgi:hypothetical protein